MGATYYHLAFSGLLSHWRTPPLVCDQEIRFRSVACVEAEIQSGDLFVTLATQLDTISRATSDYNVKICLENIVSDLIYLQDNYTIVKNKKPE